MKKIISFVLIAIMALSFSSCGRASEYIGELHVYCFGDYFDPELMYKFEDETGIMVVLDSFDTNEEMYPVIKNGTADYDLICCSEYMISQLIAEDLIQKVNKENIPNLKYIDEKNLKMLESIDEGNQYAVPHTWGTYGILYNTDHIKKGEITSWKDLWNEKYSNQIIMLDSLRDAMMIPLKILGCSENTLSEEEVSKATDLLISQKPLVYKYANDATRDLMIGDAADIAVITSGEVLYVQDCNDHMNYVIPKEGTEVWSDCWAITKSTKNKEYAEKFINFMLRPENALANFEYLTYAIPNTGMYSMMDKEYLNNEVLFPSDETLERCETLVTLDADTRKMYSRYWKKFKAI
ncbi:MAG: ABC transporter substrate-binding protein [Clostridia bacterium]|nr:ABC transporter substrate-binding protein [Clostridia bacterium]